MIFGKLNEYFFYENFDELVFLLNHYSDKDKLDDLRIILEKNFNYLDFSIGEVSNYIMLLNQFKFNNINFYE